MNKRSAQIVQVSLYEYERLLFMGGKSRYTRVDVECAFMQIQDIGNIHTAFQSCTAMVLVFAPGSVPPPAPSAQGAKPTLLGSVTPTHQSAKGLPLQETSEF